MDEGTAHDIRRLTRAAWRARQATLERDAVICELRVKGVSLRQIAEAAGLSHTAIAKIVHRTASL